VPGKDRQRALARAKLERQMARRAIAARRRRQMRAALGAVVAVILVAAGCWFLIAKLVDSDDKTGTSASGADCLYNPIPAAQAKQAPKGSREVGSPSTSAIPDSGSQTVTLTLDGAPVTFTMDLAVSPCTAHSFAFLSSKKYYDNTPCHRVVTEGIFVLQCGDPSGTGTGSPGYQFGTENLPANSHPPYPAGTVAMARGEDPGTNGSQFFLVYKDGSNLPADYSVFGHVTSGLGVIQQIAARGTSNGKTDGPPKKKVTLGEVSVSAPAKTAPSEAASPASGSATPTQAGSPSSAPPKS
jgi:peptidyl-prolyl cis-trans isomerase B (cyclophilin B)